MALCLGIVAVVGFVDYLTGYETFCFIFYLFAVFLAVWFVGGFFGGVISALSVTAWISTNIAAGERYSSYFVPVWNALIMFVFYPCCGGASGQTPNHAQGIGRAGASANRHVDK